MIKGGGEPEGAMKPPPEPREDHEPSAPETPPLGDHATHPELLPSRGPFRPILKAVGLAEQAIGASFIVVILILVLIQVASRYSPLGGWSWTGEIARLALVWCTFILAGYLMGQDRHITIKVVDFVLAGRSLGVVKLMSHLVVAATCLGMCYASYRLIADDIGQRTPAAEIPITWVYVIPMIGFFLTALRAVMIIGMVDIRELGRGQEKTA
jgi:TRAP-type C4-dicarboxylate transport system permease small subunit